MSFNIFLRWEDSRFIDKHLLEGSKIHVSRVQNQVICGKKGILPQCIGCVIFRKFLQLGKKNLSAAPLLILKIPENNKHLDVSENSGTPKSSILIRFSIINYIHFGVPLVFGNTHSRHCDVINPKQL